MTKPADPVSPDRLPARVEDAYRAYRRELLGLARLLTGSSEAAEEVVQEAFLTLHRRITETEPGRELAYLRRAVTYQARTGWRRKATRRRWRHIVSADAAVWRTPEHDALRSAARARTDQALDRLSDRQRECIVLTYFGELSVAEVAETLGIAEGSVKTHLHRGRSALAPLLEDLR